GIRIRIRKRRRFRRSTVTLLSDTGGSTATAPRPGAPAGRTVPDTASPLGARRRRGRATPAMDTRRRHGCATPPRTRNSHHGHATAELPTAAPRARHDHVITRSG